MPPGDAHARRSSRKRRIPPELLPLAGVAELLSVGLSTAERLKAAGKLGPRPRLLAGPKWSVRELRAWIAHPGPNGELLDVYQWPAIWQQLQAADRRHR